MRFYLGEHEAVQSSLRIEYKGRYLSKLLPENFSVEDFSNMIAQLPYREPFKDKVRKTKRPFGSWSIGVSRPIKDPIRDIHSQLCEELNRTWK